MTFDPVAAVRVLVFEPGSTQVVVRSLKPADLAAVVGGFLEAVDVSPRLSLWFDEEGKVKGLDVNEAATALARVAGIAAADYIVGTAVLTGMTDGDPGMGLVIADVPGSVLDTLRGHGLSLIEA